MAWRCLVVGVLGLASLPAAAAKKQRLAVLALKAEGVEPQLASTIDETLTSDLGRAGKYEVIGRSEIEAMAGFQSERMKLGCTGDTGCLAEIGGALGVDRLVFGSLGKVGSLYVLNTKLIEIHNAKVIARDTETVNSADDLIAATGRAAQILLGELPAPLTATAEAHTGGGLRHSPWPWLLIGTAAAAGAVGGYFGYAVSQDWTTFAGSGRTDTVSAANGNRDQLIEGVLYGVALAAGLTGVGMLVF